MSKQQITSIDDEADDDFAAHDEASPVPVTSRGKRGGKEMPSFSFPDASGERKVITIHHGEGKLGASAAFVAVNGHAFHIPRGIKVSLPVEIVAALDTAVNIVYEQVDKEMVPREVRRFPYSEHASA